MLASAAIPTLFRSVHEAGGVYWDGLFSQNPPVRDLLATEPDEIWVIQINAKERSAEPRTMVEIADRRNELSGNLSLYQELHFIEQIDSMIEDGRPGRRRVQADHHPDHRDVPLGQVAEARRRVEDQPRPGTSSTS